MLTSKFEKVASISTYEKCNDKTLNEG